MLARFYWQQLYSFKDTTVSKIYLLPGLATNTAGFVLGTAIDVTTRILKGGLHLAEAMINKTANLTTSSLLLVRNTVTRGADGAISLLERAKTRTSETMKVVGDKVDYLSEISKQSVDSAKNLVQNRRNKQIGRPRQNKPKTTHRKKELASALETFLTTTKSNGSSEHTKYPKDHGIKSLNEHLVQFKQEWDESESTEEEKISLSELDHHLTTTLSKFNHLEERNDPNVVETEMNTLTTELLEVVEKIMKKLDETSNEKGFKDIALESYRMLSTDQ